MTSIKVTKEEHDRKTDLVKQFVLLCGNCECTTFHISRSRDVYCTGCRKRIPNTTVYTNMTSSSEQIQ